MDGYRRVSWSGWWLWAFRSRFTDGSEPWHRRSHIKMLPSRPHVASTLSLDPGWKRTCLMEDSCPARQAIDFCVRISMIKPVWSPDAVARRVSSLEKLRSINALSWGRSERKALEKPTLSSFAESIRRTPPSSSPMAMREFARTMLAPFGRAVGLTRGSQNS